MKIDAKVRFLNQLSHSIHFDQYKLLALSRFEWTGLPEGMKPWYIERVLFDHGRAVFFKDSSGALLVMSSSGGSGLVDVYGEALKFHMTAPNGKTWTKNRDDCVEIKNNMIRKPTLDAIMYFANKVVECDRTTDTNVAQQKIVKVVMGDDNNMLSLKNIERKIANNEPVVFAHKTFDKDAWDTFDLSAPFIVDKMTDYYHDLNNRVNTFLGIQNANTDKRERLNTDEVNANNDEIGFNVKHMLKSRKEAVKEINAMFGTSISVELSDMEGGTEDGETDSNTVQDS